MTPNVSIKEIIVLALLAALMSYGGVRIIHNKVSTELLMVARGE